MDIFRTVRVEDAWQAYIVHRMFKSNLLLKVTVLHHYEPEIDMLDFSVISDGYLFVLNLLPLVQIL